MTLFADAEIIKKRVRLVTNNIGIKENADIIREFLDQIEDVADFVIIVPKGDDSPTFWTVLGAYLAVKVCFEKILVLIENEIVEVKV